MDYLQPWKTGPYDPRYVFNRKGDEVATVHFNYQMAIPIARLISAAPELLEALEMVRDADNDNGRKMPTPARAKVDAAIAKATGNSVTRGRE